MLNVVAIMGRLVADPELRTTQSGTNVCSFRIACDRNFARQGEQRQADFIDIVAWRQQAEFVSKYFQKGSLIVGKSDRHRRQSPDPPVSGQERKQPHRCGGRGKQRQLCWLQIEWQQSGRQQLSECCAVLPERSACPPGCCGGSSQLLRRKRRRLRRHRRQRRPAVLIPEPVF